MPDVTILIATRNRSASLRRCLLSIRPPSNGTLEVIVVDNGSEDNTREEVVLLTPRLPFDLKYFKEERIGKTFALIEGVKHAAGKIVLFTDDDITFSERWVDHCLECFKVTSCAGMGGPVIPVFYHPQRRWMSHKSKYQITAPHTWDLGDSIINLTETGHGKPSGNNMGFLRELFSDKNLLDPRLGLFGGRRINGEDTHISSRLIMEGYRIMYWPAAKVFHHIENPKHYTIAHFLKWHYASGVGNVIRARSLDPASYRLPEFWLWNEATQHLLKLVLRGLTLNAQACLYHMFRLSVYLGSIRQMLRVNSCRK